MDESCPKLGIFLLLRDSLSTRRYLLFASFILFLILGLFGGSAAANADFRNAPVTSLGPNTQFAIDDFDGDLRPDVASIQVGQSGLSRTDYWIQLQLSEVGRQFIRVVGPNGGLSIEARDVNGDRAIDLVLVTAWRRQPVAILLNDGHGSFSRADPTAFPDAFSEPATMWAPASEQTNEADGVPPTPRAGACQKTRVRLHFRTHADSIPQLSAGFLFDPFLVSHGGRAPPL
jgi:hypothetical protein